MKAWIPWALGWLTLATGCATRPPEAPERIIYTHGASGERTPGYFRCVSQAALPMAHAPATPTAIARFAASRCSALRQTITSALEEENAGKPLAQHYASTFGDALEARVVQHVAGLVRVARRR